MLRTWGDIGLGFSLPGRRKVGSAGQSHCIVYPGIVGVSVFQHNPKKLTWGVLRRNTSTNTGDRPQTAPGEPTFLKARRIQQHQLAQAFKGSKA
ncbi:MAG: hypothetical protein IPL65_14565 [Lewinellaceae bacterium]|nr:hypothetical protein [Lewinellaceae bacterium]